MIQSGSFNFEPQYPQRSPPPPPAAEQKSDGIKKEGEEEGVKGEAKQEEIETQKFKETVEHGQRVLFKTSAVFPFDLFPNQITVDINQVNVIIRIFFWAERRHSILIRDISDVLIDTGPFFATIKIIDFGFREDSIDIGFLKRGDAIRLRQIIQGLMVLSRQGIDLSHVSFDYICQEIEELGKATEAEKVEKKE